MTFRKLLIIRKAKMRSDALATAGLSQFVEGEPLAVSPLAWQPEDGLSHWGFVLGGMKLADLEAVKAFEQANAASTLLDLPEDPETSLASVGLRIHPAA